MHAALRLDGTPDDLGLRLQAPTVVGDGGDQVHAVARSDGGVFTWSDDGGPVAIEATCAPERAGTWLCRLAVTNTSDRRRQVRITYPYVCYDFDHGPVRTLNPRFGGVLETSPGAMCVAYPGPATFCATAAASDRRCVAVGLFDGDQRRVQVHHVPGGRTGQIRLVVEAVDLAPGATVTLPDQFICVGTDWAQALAPYRDWIATMFPARADRPRWLVDEPFSETRNAHCVAPFAPTPDAAVGIWVFDSDGERQSFEQLRRQVDDAVDDGKQSDYVPLFYLFGWWQSMTEISGVFLFDSVCGDYLQAHDLAAQVIAYIHECGARVYLYTNAIAAGDETDVVAQHPDLFVHDRSGAPVTNGELPMFMFCPGAQGIRGYWDEVLRYVLLDADADGIFLDQVCGPDAVSYCHDDRHGHSDPDEYGRGLIGLLGHIRSTAKGLKPDCYVGGELVLDSRSGLLDETHGYGYTAPMTRPPATVEAQRATAPAEYYIFTRYLVPNAFTQVGRDDADIMNGAAGHHRSALWREHRATFESGVVPCRTDAPGAVAYLFGPHDDEYVLAVRSHGDIGEVEIVLPDGRTHRCHATTTPQYFPLPVHGCSAQH